MLKLFSYIRGILEHPMNSNNSLKALYKIFKWQFWFKFILIKDTIVVRYLDTCLIRVNRNFPSSTGVYYFEIPEYHEMLFLMRYLDGDVFVDVGANVGIYSILAGRIGGCDLHTFEPDPFAFAELELNLELNNISCQKYNVALGDTRSELLFTSDLTSENHVVESDCGDNRIVQCHMLNEFLNDVNIIKVDVEGFELQVLKGAQSLLSKTTCMVLIVEIKKHTSRYGYSEKEIFLFLEALGFVSVNYDHNRNEVFLSDKMLDENYLFVKDVESVNKRLKSKE